MAVITLTNGNYEEEVVKSEKPVLIDFWASWCGPCKMFSPIIDEIAEESEDIKVCKLNVDDEMELAQKFRVSGIPTIVLMKNGEVAAKSVGAKSKEEVLDFIKNA